MSSQRTVNTDAGRSVFTYDDLGREVCVEDFDDAGALTMQIKRQLSNDGRELARLVTDGEGRQLRRFSFERNGRNCLVKEYDDSDALVAEYAEQER